MVDNGDKGQRKLSYDLASLLPGGSLEGAGVWGGQDCRFTIHVCRLSNTVKLKIIMSPEIRPFTFAVCRLSNIVEAENNYESGK
jgi:hypothetical protein